jgi:hypothetical protein
MDALLAMETAELGRQNFIPAIASEPSRWDLEGQLEESGRRPRKKKNKTSQLDGDDDDAFRVRRKMEKDAEIRRKMFHRRIHVAKTTAVRHRMTTRRAASSSSPLRDLHASNNTTRRKHEFTFTAEPGNEPGSAEQSPESSVDLTSSWQSLPDSSTSPDQPTPESPFPSVTLQPPSGNIPFSLRPPKTDEHPPPYPSRPVLPTLPLPRSGSSTPFLYSPGRTNLDSPSHSTYRAPEELAATLDAGPSDYFAEDGGNGSALDPGNLKMEVTEKTTATTSQTSDAAHDTDSLSDLDQGDIQAEHDRYFADASGTGPPGLIELLSDSESDVTTEDDGRDVGDLDDDDDGQAVDLFGGEIANAGAVQVGENAFGDGNLVRADGAPHPQAANQPAAEGPAAANAENEEAEANVEDDMEGAMEGMFFHSSLLPRYLLQYSSYRDERPNLWRFSKCAPSSSDSLSVLICLGCLNDIRA